MEVLRIKLLGSVNIGLYAKATNRFLFYHADIIKRKVDTLIEKLGVEGVPLKPTNTRIVSPFFAANDAGIVLSKYVYPDIRESLIEAAKVCKLNIVELDTKYTAVGNLVILGDRVALVSPLIPHAARKLIADALNVEVACITIGRTSYIGSLLVVNSKGGLAAPIIRDDELDIIQSLLKVNVYTGTVNNGIQFISSGLIANDRVIFVGEDTVGRELFVISQAFGGE